MSKLIARALISSAGDLGQSFFFPATSTNPNNYNKSYLNCPFQPYTMLKIAEVGRARRRAGEHRDAGRLHDRRAATRWARRSAWWSRTWRARRS